MTTFYRYFKFEENIMVRVFISIRKCKKIVNITQEQLAVDFEKSYDFIRRLEYKNGRGVFSYLVVLKNIIIFIIY